MSFFCAMCRNAQNRSFKKWRRQRIRFLAYILPKNIDINLKFGLSDVQAWFYNIFSVCLNFFKILDFVESYIRSPVFIFWVTKLFWGKSEMTILKISLFCVYWCLLFAFCLNRCFWWFFQTFIYFRPKMGWHWVTYNGIIQKKSRKFSKVFRKDVKLMYQEVYQVSRRYL